ncbi:guanylate kinase [Sodiomyces alkalinus F11]|uniref:Guanylate kinase n=1 Tax=Sodiomyces alkalinus (strain CBS 110278 / VKM F-3762 / F11) TaxID=1314773 RepID=A0A3N2Q7V4_SODAK|nr:guanylate kinase [Sodiomyces alkalinus F11]ROT42796.1 guanylate kinase [Sodiomyces alkalinus F11]
MPGAIIAHSDRVPAVTEFAVLLDDLLTHASQTKPASIDPALHKSDFGDLDGRISAMFRSDAPGDQENGIADTSPKKDKTRQFAVIETAVRSLFDHLIATTAIDSPGFVQLWNLLDLVSILSDDEHCDPALLFWLIEEMLDSQTIAQCQKVFDYLESRRERITSSHFKQKHLVILRSCNELLRRLSRAEDTAFCGRVFIFMFQSFPLGDRSSVNLRGEYHVENVTTYDKSEPAPEETQDKMEIDKVSTSQGKAVTFDSTKQAPQDQPIKADVLYPIFWSLQKTFSQPKKLFDAESLSGFKRGLEATMKMFKAVQDEQEASPPKGSGESSASFKRKREPDAESDLASAFNPKYLTSRDLFELEISDLSFRRHILVQTFIITEFLLYLSPKAKEKLASIKTPNKSVMYLDQVLSDEDVKWAMDMKRTVEDSLKFGDDGPQFHRMVDTVLARDKNWVRWKAGNCPSIELPPLPAQTWATAQEELHRLCRNKRLRPPMGSLPLNFMEDGDDQQALARLKAAGRYELPELDSFRRKIADDDFEIEMPTSEESKAAAIEAKASKSWRALRIAAKTKLGLFDKISDPEKIDPIFEELEDPDADPVDAEDVVQKDNVPKDQRPIVITGPSGVGKTVMTNLLAERRPGAFVRVGRHTTRKPQEGEIGGEHFHFIEKQAFGMLRDGDVLLEYTTAGDVDYGTSRKVVEGITNGGKVPVLHLDQEGTRQVRDLGFDARFVLLLPPSKEVMEERLKKAGNKDDDSIQSLLKAATPYLADDSNLKEGCDLVLVNDELETTCTNLEKFIFGASPTEEDQNDGQNGESDRSSQSLA